MKTTMILAVLLVAGCGERPLYGPGAAAVDPPAGPTMVTTDLRVVGTWLNGQSTLAIHDTGIYSLVTADAKVGGSWNADGKTLTLTELYPSQFLYTVDDKTMTFGDWAWMKQPE